MKLSSFLLMASLAANVFLLGVVANRLITPEEPGAEMATDRPQSMESPDTRLIEGELFGSRGNASGSTGLWKHLETDDLLQLSTRLRAAGFPLTAVRAIIFDLAAAKGEIARAAIQGKTADIPYWKTVPYFPDDPALRARVQEVNEELNTLYRTFFYNAEAIAEDEGFAASIRQQYGNLPIGTLQRLFQIQSDYDELRGEVHEAQSAGAERELTAGEREKLALLDGQQRQDFQEVLTPEEFAEYELRSSATSRRLRSQLDLFRPNEAEYKALYTLHRAVDDELGELGPELAHRQAEALRAIAPQIEATLGPERYADYVQAMEHGSSPLNRLIARLDLPLSSVGRIETVKSDIIRRAAAVRANTQLPLASQHHEIQALVREAEATLTSALGTRGYSAYEEVEGDWLHTLALPPN